MADELDRHADPLLQLLPRGPIGQQAQFGRKIGSINPHGLTGLDKAETAARHGDAQVKIWRRSYDIPPPPLEASAGYDFAADRRYAGVDVPATESLKTTLERVLPYWTAEIAPRLTRGETVLVAAHGNSLRAIVKHLFGVADDKITGVEIPTANPLVLDLAEGGAKVVGARYLDAARANALPSIA